MLCQVQGVGPLDVSLAKIAGRGRVVRPQLATLSQEVRQRVRFDPVVICGRAHTSGRFKAALPPSQSAARKPGKDTFGLSVQGVGKIRVRVSAPELPGERNQPRLSS